MVYFVNKYFACSQNCCGRILIQSLMQLLQLQRIQKKEEEYQLFNFQRVLFPDFSVLHRIIMRKLIQLMLQRELSNNFVQQWTQHRKSIMHLIWIVSINDTHTTRQLPKWRQKGINLPVFLGRLFTQFWLIQTQRSGILLRCAGSSPYQVTQAIVLKVKDG